MFSNNDVASTLVLHSSAGEFLIDGSHWHYVLQLAQALGWRPDGPPIPPDAPRPAAWGTEYLFRHNQRISTRDTQEIAATLKRALPDIPDHDARGGGRSESLLARFSGPGKPWLQTLIHFLDAGSFIVTAGPVGADLEVAA